MRRKLRRSFILIAATSSALCGCASMGARSGHPGGDRRWPTAMRWKGAAVHALRDPVTWGPAAAAAAVGLVDDWDLKISDWAVDRTPVFGSPARARHASNYLRTASHAAMIASSLAVPRSEDPWGSKLGRLVVEEGSDLLTDATTLFLKKTTNRERPDESGGDSFPSGHTSGAFSDVALSSRNFDDLDLSTRARTGWNIGVFALASGTAWGRVEGGVHFPSDVLAGAALGSFFGRFIHDAFLERTDSSSVAACVGRQGSYLVVNLRF